MKKAAVVLVLALAASVALAEGAADGAATAPAAAAAPHAQAAAATPKAHILSRAEADRLLAQPDKVLVIDVRRPDEISSIGGLPVYLNIQIKDLESRLAWIPKGRSIITVSNHSNRSVVAADLLARKGFKVAGALGAQLYEQQGGTLAHVPIPTRAAAAASAAH
jgi:rhodanese-related sulfurtransferase